MAIYREILLVFSPNLSLLVPQSSIIFCFFYFLATIKNMDEEVSPSPLPLWKTELQRLFASLKQDLSQQIESKFRVLDGPESDEDVSSTAGA